MGAVAGLEKEPCVNRSAQDQALEVATEAARKAGHVILSYHRSSYDACQKSVDNPVTTADICRFEQKLEIEIE